ncbi:hypothetical protein [Paraferrimonas sp. SM1919]|uniref:hypothetical protein n=1 Tax=Paraferrimonas sp. SM1919 TaxID=2662263 RepID=UPI0013D43A04|nr:hypothetical protein [Paraferrimonas sp. SM1919]
MMKYISVVFMLMTLSFSALADEFKGRLQSVEKNVIVLTDGRRGADNFVERRFAVGPNTKVFFREDGKNWQRVGFDKLKYNARMSVQPFADNPEIADKIHIINY